MRALSNQELRGIAVQRVREVGVGAALVEQVAPRAGAIARHLHRGHAMEPVLREISGEPHTGQVGIIFGDRLGHPIHSKVARPYDLGSYCPGIFERGVLRLYRITCDSVTESVAIT